MLGWISVVAGAAEPATPYPPALPALPEWLVRSGTLWLRDGDTCFAAKTEDAAHAAFFVRVCEERSPDGGDDLVCDQRFAVEDGWEWRDQRCRFGLTGPSATRTVTGLGPRAVLSGADAGLASWSPRVDLEPVASRPMIEQRPCDAASLAELGKSARKEAGKDPAAQAAWLAERGVVDGVRRCEVSDGVTLVAVAPGRTRTVTPGTRTGTAAVDCRVPCAPAPALAQVEAARAQVAGRSFFDPAAPTLRLYTSKDACLASAPAEAVLARDLCATLGAQLRAQAK